jgi:hypothetical protein
MKVIRAFGALASRLGLSNSLGQMFAGSRDTYAVFGYTKNVTTDQLMARFMRQDIAARIVEAPCSAVWSDPPMILSTSQEWNKLWAEFVHTHKLYHVLNRVDILAGLGRYAVLYIGFKNGGLVEQPITKKASNEVLYLQPYAENAAQIYSLINDPRNERYMLPEWYNLYPFKNQQEAGKVSMTPMLPATQPSLKAHGTRVLHVAENCLENNLIGYPRMERVVNILDDILKTAGGTAESYWLTANRGLQVDIDKEMELTAEDEAALSDEIDEYQHQLRRVLRTRGVKINSLGSDTPDPRGPFSVFMSLLSAATGIPQRVLTGAEAGQLASEQDRANWADRVDERRRLYAEPVILRPLIQILTAAGVLPELEPNAIQIKWRPAFKMSPLEESQARAQQARSAVNLSRTLTDQARLSSPFITVEEARFFVGLALQNPVFNETSDVGKEGALPQGTVPELKEVSTPEVPGGDGNGFVEKPGAKPDAAKEKDIEEKTGIKSDPEE